MTESEIRKAHARIREIDNTIPDDVLNFMKDASIQKVRLSSKKIEDLKKLTLEFTCNILEEVVENKSLLGKLEIAANLVGRDYEAGYREALKHKKEEILEIKNKLK